MISNEITFKTGAKQYRTPLNFNVRCDDIDMIHAIELIGGKINYLSERSMYFHLDGVRMNIGHNWMNQKYVQATKLGVSNEIGEELEDIVAEAISHL